MLCCVVSGIGMAARGGERRRGKEEEEEKDEGEKGNDLEYF